jgi:hypothetical protein
LVVFPLSLVFFSAPVRADSAATAIATLDWGAATFSGSVMPASIPNPYSSLTEVLLASEPSGSFVGGSTVTSPGWTPTTDSMANGAASVMFAQSDAHIVARTTAVASDGLFSLNSQAERSGDLTTSTGWIEISVPYSLSVLLTPGTNKSASAEVWIDVFNVQGNTLMGDVTKRIVVPAGFVGRQRASGMLTLDIDEAPGTYWFDFGAASSSVIVAEPSVLLLALVGLFSALFLKKLVT